MGVDPEVGVLAEAGAGGGGACARKACLGRWETQGGLHCWDCRPKVTELGAASSQCPQDAGGHRKRNPSSQVLGQSLEWEGLWCQVLGGLREGSLEGHNMGLSRWGNRHSMKKEQHLQGELCSCQGLHTVAGRTVCYPVIVSR